MLFYAHSVHGLCNMGELANWEPTPSYSSLWISKWGSILNSVQTQDPHLPSDKGCISTAGLPSLAASPSQEQTALPPTWQAQTGMDSWQERKQRGVPCPHPLPSQPSFFTPVLAKQPDWSTDFFVSLLTLVQELLEIHSANKQLARGRRSQGKGPSNHMSACPALSERRSAPWGFIYSWALESDGVGFKPRSVLY